MIFRAYDIRGIYPSELDVNLAAKLGLAFGNLVPGKLMVGQDMRLSSPSLTRALTSGLLAAGCNVVDIGMVASPVLYYGVVTRKLDGGAMVTASHNPPEYAGFKFCKKNAVCLTEDSGIMDLKKMVEGKLKQTSWQKVGKFSTENIIPEYLEHISKLVNPEKRLKVVVDVGNGSAGFSKELFEKFCDVKMLFQEPDGRFPNHVPDPLKEENLETLKKEVKNQGADLGMGLDGDGDRVGFVDDKGRFISGDITLMLFAKNALEKKPGGKVLYEVRCSRALEEFVRELRGKPIMTRIGHSYIHEAVLKEKALLAGELSGHFYFGDGYFGYDDGIFTGLKMIEAVSKIGKLSEFIDKLPKYPASPEYRIECPDNKKFKIVEEIKKEFLKSGNKVITLDGARVEFPDGWVLIRASNTQPALVTRAEGKSQEVVKKLEKLVMDKVKTRLGNIRIL